MKKCTDRKGITILMALLLLQNFCACKLQLKQDALLSQRKGVGKQRKAFDTACNI